MLEVKDLYFRYRGEKKDTLKGISLKAERGKVTAVLGPNGSGKSTLFKCICGIVDDFRGEVIIDGTSLKKMSFRKRARLISFVPQGHNPPFSYTVFDVVLMGRASYVGMFSSPKKDDIKMAEDSMKTVGIYHLKDKAYTEISGGERQLTLIARALAQKAPVMILDEPVSHLDFKNQLKILNLIKRLSEKKEICVLMSLHDPNLVLNFSDKVIVLKDGKKIEEGRPEEVLKEELIRYVYGIDVRIISSDGKKTMIPVLTED